MKTLKIFLLSAGIVSLTPSVSAQNVVSMATKTQVIDVKGQNFLSAFKRGNIAIIQERDESGNIVWQDSLNNDNTLSNLDSVSFCKFNNGNQVAVFLARKVNTNTLELFYTTITLDQHKFGTARTMQLSTRSIFRTCAKNNSVYLFTNKWIVSGTLSHDIFELVADSEISSTPLKSDLRTSPVGDLFSYEVHAINGGLSFLYHDYGDVFIKKYDDNFTQIGDSSYCSAVGSYDFAAPYLINYSDNIISLAFYGYKTQQQKSAWVFSRSADDFENPTSQVYEFDTQAGTTYYSITSVASDTLGNTYILASQNDGSLEHPLYLFKYDEAFNPTCSLRLFLTDNADSKLTVINDVPYIISDDASATKLYPISNCSSPASIDTQEINKGTTFTVYPNPSKGQFSIKRFQELTGSKVLVQNTLGQTAYHGDFTGLTQILNLNLKSGVYLVELDGQVQKLIIE